jgi:hypothetical protein
MLLVAAAIIFVLALLLWVVLTGWGDDDECDS